MTKLPAFINGLPARNEEAPVWDCREPTIGHACNTLYQSDHGEVDGDGFFWMGFTGWDQFAQGSVEDGDLSQGVYQYFIFHFKAYAGQPSSHTNHIYLEWYDADISGQFSFGPSSNGDGQTVAYPHIAPSPARSRKADTIDYTGKGPLKDRQSCIDLTGIDPEAIRMTDPNQRNRQESVSFHGGPGGTPAYFARSVAYSNPPPSLINNFDYGTGYGLQPVGAGDGIAYQGHMIASMGLEFAGALTGKYWGPLSGGNFDYPFSGGSACPWTAWLPDYAPGAPFVSGVKVKDTYTVDNGVTEENVAVAHEAVGFINGTANAVLSDWTIVGDDVSGYKLFDAIFEKQRDYHNVHGGYEIFRDQLGILKGELTFDGYLTYLTGGTIGSGTSGPGWSYSSSLDTSEATVSWDLKEADWLLEVR